MYTTRAYVDRSDNGFISPFCRAYITPLVNYIVEQIDESSIILFVLRKYKYRCEWFKKEYLQNTCSSPDNNSLEEKKLARDLYEYLHLHNINFFIEPKSESGRIDLVSLFDNDPVYSEIKVFSDPKKSSQNKSSISAGFNQLNCYLRDYNKHFGYMIIFNNSGKDFIIDTTDQEHSVPYIRYGEKIIFFIIIDIFPHETTASKRGKMELYHITRDELIKLSQDEPAAE